MAYVGIDKGEIFDMRSEAKHMKINMLVAVFFFSLNVNAMVELDSEPKQGQMLLGQGSAKTKIWLDGKAVKVSETGRFVIGFGRDAAPSSELLLEFPDGSKQLEKLKVTQRNYDIQRVDGISKKIMLPSDEAIKRIIQDVADTKAARKTVSSLPHFAEPFIRPVKEARITGVYGSQRIYNGKPNRPHFGIDYAAPKGTAVVAPAAGVVLLTKDMFYSGHTILLDHGYGVTSSFLHLSKMLVQPGDLVVQGQKIGEIGSTGRSTGPHLDWRVNWQDVRLDPALILEKYQ
eukprot:GHVR01050536.1.p1 GENE.GHVR01050536.1~~GHVR01050536.1.p1  ORF type:complete len:288 (-),score=26.54 GHVR01050536.1:112-975(-)